MRLCLAIFLTLLSSVETKAYAEEALWVVSSNPDVSSLTAGELKQIYLEQGNQYRLSPLHLQRGNKLRAVFNTQVIGLTESRIQSYWVQMQFTGRANPPTEKRSVTDILLHLKQYTGWVAYVPAGIELPERVNVVFTINAAN